jgi:hypothetical protein
VTKERIIEIIKDEVEYWEWDYDKCLEALDTLNFEIDSVVGNELFGESKVKTMVAMAYNAFA